MFIGDPTPLPDGRHVAHVHREDGFCYVTDPQAVPEDAILEAKKWAQWHDALQAGQSADTVYYIVSISPVWPGPALADHRYSGLQVKIGRAKDVMRRLANLRTGASAGSHHSCARTRRSGGRGRKTRSVRG